MIKQSVKLLVSIIDQIDVIKIDIEGGEVLAFAWMQEFFLNNGDLSIVSEWNPSALESAGVFH